MGWRGEGDNTIIISDLLMIIVKLSKRILTRVHSDSPCNLLFSMKITHVISHIVDGDIALSSTILLACPPPGQVTIIIDNVHQITFHKTQFFSCSCRIIIQSNIDWIIWRFFYNRFGSPDWSCSCWLLYK